MCLWDRGIEPSMFGVLLLSAEKKHFHGRADEFEEFDFTAGRGRCEL